MAGPIDLTTICSPAGDGVASWALLAPGDAVSTHDPNNMVVAGPTVDGDGYWSVDLSQPGVLADQHLGSGASVWTFDLPFAGQYAEEEVWFLLEMDKPSAGGWGMGIGLGDYANSEVHVLQGQFVVGVNPDEWRMATVDWSNLSSSVVNVPDAASAQLRGNVCWYASTNNHMILNGTLVSAAPGVVDLWGENGTDTLANPEIQLVLTTAENASQTGTLRFRPWVIRPAFA